MPPRPSSPVISYPGTVGSPSPGLARMESRRPSRPAIRSPRARRGRRAGRWRRNSEIHRLVGQFFQRLLARGAISTCRSSSSSSVWSTRSFSSRSSMSRSGQSFIRFVQLPDLGPDHLLDLALGRVDARDVHLEPGGRGGARTSLERRQPKGVPGPRPPAAAPVIAWSISSRRNSSARCSTRSSPATMFSKSSSIRVAAGDALRFARRPGRARRDGSASLTMRETP